MNQSLSMLSLFKQHVAEMMADTRIQYDNLATVQDRLYAINDKTIEKMAYVYREQGDNIDLFRKQAHRWLTQSLNPEEEYAVEKFLIQLDDLEKITQRVMTLVNKITPHPVWRAASTINTETGENK